MSENKENLEMNNQALETEDNEEAEQKEANKKARSKIVIFLAAVSLAGVGYFTYWNTYASKFETTENAYVNAHQYTITTQVGGTLTDMFVDDTVKVKAGSLIAVVEKIDYQLAYDRARNDLAKAVRSVGTLAFDKSQSEESLRLKQIDFKKADADYKRDKKAFESGVLSKEQFDNVAHIYNQTKLGIELAKTSLQSTTLKSRSDAIQNHPDVAHAINLFKQAYLDLQRTDILAPADGIVAKKAVQAGQRVSPTQTLLTLVDLDNAWVDVNLKESQIENLQIGQRVELHSDVNKKTYEGVVVGIGAGSGTSMSLLPAQNATGNWIKIVQRVPVKVAFTKESLKQNGTIPVGTSMHAKVHLTETLSPLAIEAQKVKIAYAEEELNKQIEQIIRDNSLGK